MQSNWSISRISNRLNQSCFVSYFIFGERKLSLLGWKEACPTKTRLKSFSKVNNIITQFSVRNKKEKMDLGFGNQNHTVGNAAAQALLQGAKAQEETVEAELAHFDRLLDDEEGLEEIRRRRIAQMQKKHSQQKKWRDMGHGSYDELGGGHDARDVARDFFQASKDSDRLVVHFYRPSTRFCDVFHAHLAKLAPKHIETKFVKINVEDCDHHGGGAA